MTDHDELIKVYTPCNSHAKYKGYCIDCKDASLIDSIRQLQARNAELEAQIKELEGSKALLWRAFKKRRC
ncbi:MAG: keratin [Planctomycetes bacterium]|nr:keratin [Planctomycetota bacterium]